MASNKEREFVEHLNDSKIIKVKVDDEMKKSFIEYAMAVNVSRAIPDVRDGLKPVHRRILFSMNELGLTNDKPFRKCALIVGDVLGKYHPHGDSSVYDALVRLAQDFSIRYPLVDGHGNFGSVDGHKAAAYRYTEARLAKVANEMLRDIDKETVDFYPNFDETRMQPVVLPARFPNLLVNGSDGIAVGMATSIPPHNLSEVIDGTVALLENPDIDIDSLIDLIPAPDYPTGALVLGTAAIREAYRTGRGGAIIRSKAEIEEVPSGKFEIVVTEIPYQVNKANLIKSIADLVKDKKIEGISDVREESDREGMRIVVEVKRDANPQVVLNTLYKQTQLQVSNSMIMLCLVDGQPRILNLKEILQYYIQHQESVVVRRTQYDLNKAEEREHIVHGLVIAQANIDEVVQIIKTSADKADAMQRLMDRFELSERQTNSILEMPLRRLTGLEVEKLREELEQLRADIERYREILGNMRLVNEIIRNELLEIKEKYGTPRLSQLCYDASDINIEDLIAREDIVVSLTHFGYIKRMAVSEYDNQHRGGKGIQGHKPKEDDFVESMFITHTHEPIMFFTNKGKVYRMKGYEVPEAPRTSRGRAIVNLLNLEADEKVTAMLRCPAEQEGFLMLATKQGKIKKTSLREFDSIRVTGKIAITLIDDDELVAASITAGDEEILIAASNGKCIRFREQDVREMGRTAMGVRSMKLGEEDRIVDMAVIKEDCEILTVSDKGYGKRSGQDDYRCQGRAGMGVKAGNFTEETGGLAGLKILPPDMDVMLIADNGIIIRVQGDEIRRVSRASKGVIVMRLKGKSKVICVAVTPHEDPEDESAEGEIDETAETVEGGVVGDTEAVETSSVSDSADSDEE